jgi:hypothetical protein
MFQSLGKKRKWQEDFFLCINDVIEQNASFIDFKPNQKKKIILFWLLISTAMRDESCFVQSDKKRLLKTNNCYQLNS